MINGAQFHLLVNHLPVIIPLVGAPILAIGVLIRSSDIQQVGLWLLVVSGLAAIATYLTGEPAEAVVKNYPGISRFLIEEHEKFALYALIGIEISAMGSLLLLITTRLHKKTPPLFWFGLILISLVSIGLMMNTAHLGGEIRHEEIRTEEPPPPTR